MGCLEAWFYYVVASCLKPNKNKLSVSCKIDLTCTLLFNFPFLAFTHFLNLPILSETWLRFVWFLLLQIWTNRCQHLLWYSNWSPNVQMLLLVSLKIKIAYFFIKRGEDSIGSVCKKLKRTRVVWYNFLKIKPKTFQFSPHCLPFLRHLLISFTLAQVLENRLTLILD